MGGFDHNPAQHDEPEDAATSARNARYGMVLFLIYLTVYVGFVALNAFNSAVMLWPAVLGLNLAVAYGFALILAALVLAGVYGWLCRSPKTQSHSPRGPA